MMFNIDHPSLLRDVQCVYLSSPQGCFIHVQLFDRSSEAALNPPGGDNLVWHSSDILLHPIKQFLGMVLQIGG